MTRDKPLRNSLVRIAANVAALVIAFPAMMWGLFMIALTAGIIGLAIGAGIGLAAYRLGVWPAIALSALVVFGFVIPNDTSDCLDDPTCDGSSNEAWPNHPVQVVLYGALIIGGAVAGIFRDVKRVRNRRSTIEAQGL